MALTALHPSLTWVMRAAVLAPLVPYLADSGTTLVRRAARGENVLGAHREHAYQRLANEAGLDHVPVAVLYAGLAALTALVVTGLVEGSRG